MITKNQKNDIIQINVKICMTLSLLFTLLFGFNANAQKWRGVDKSPLDISYMKKDRQSPPIARVIYSRPHKRDRVIFGQLVPYGKVWRTGANESAEITLYQDTSVGGTTVKAGTYTLFTIPQKDKWTLIFSNKLHQWGAYGHDKSHEVARVEASVEKASAPIENFSITFDMTGTQGKMYLGWDDTVAVVPMSVVKTK
jgi:hypothetical protein